MSNRAEESPDQCECGVHGSRQSIMALAGQVAKIDSNDQLCFDFTQGCACNHEKLRKLLRAPTGGTLSNVAWYRNRGPSQLGR